MAGHTLLARVELSEPHFGRELIGRAPLAPPPIRTPASMDATTSTITVPSTRLDTDFTRELPCTSSRPLDRIGRAGAWSLSALAQPVSHPRHEWQVDSVLVDCPGLKVRMGACHALRLLTL